MNNSPAGEPAPLSWLTKELPVSILQFSADGLIKDINEKAAECLRASHLNTPPAHFADWLSQFSAETLWRGFDQVKNSAGLFQFEARFLNSPGARRCLLTSLKEGDASGSETYALIVFDTGLSEINSESNLESQVYSLVKESTGERAWVAEKNGKPRFLGEPPGKPEQPDWNKLSQEGFLTLSAENSNYETQLVEWQLKVQTGRPFQMDTKVLCQDGSYRWHRIYAHPNAKREAATDYLWCGIIRSIETEKQLIELVANVSHEIRTPLNGILGMAQMLSRCQLTSDARDYAQTIQSAGTGLLSLLNEVLDFSRLESGKHKLTLAELDVVSIVEDAAQLFSPAAAAKGLLLIPTIGKLPSRMQSDPQSLRQVLLNLVGNAVKFTDRGLIQLTVQSIDKKDQYNWLKFSVRDSGQGIKKDELQKLFLPYSQGSVNKNSEKLGTGLGLSISQKLAELMSGQLYCEHTSEKGSIFSLEIPVGLAEENSQNNIADIWAARSTDLQLSKRVLVLEDNREGASVVAQTAETHELRASSVSTCTDALKLLETARLNNSSYQAIFLDCIRKGEECKRFLETVVVKGSSSNYSDMKIIRLLSPVSDEDDPYIELEKLDLLSNIYMPFKRRHVLAALKPPGRNLQETSETDESASTRQYDTNQLKKIKNQSITQTNSRIKRALVADDHEINQKVAAIFLRELGLEVDLVADGVEAVQAFKNSDSNYDLIFLDCQMPRLSGLDAAPIIKEMQTRRGISIPLIAVTSGASTRDRERCLMSGMDDYLCKPILADALERMVTKWLGHIPNNFTPGRPITLPAFNKTQVKLVNMQRLRSNYDNEELNQLKELFDFNFISLLNESKINLSSSDLAEFQQKIAAAMAAFQLVEADSLITLCQQIDREARQGDIGKAAGDLELVIQKTMRLYSELQSELADRTTIPHMDRAR